MVDANVLERQVEKCQVDPVVLWDLIEEGRKDSCLYEYGLTENPQGLLAELRLMVINDDSDVFLAIEGEKIIGFLGVHISEMAISSSKLANINHWYILPKHRNTRLAFRLLGAAKQWAVENGCNHLKFNTNVFFGDLIKLSRFYEKFGATLIQQSYLLEI